jgi:hypothetical protein
LSLQTRFGNGVSLGTRKSLNNGSVSIDVFSKTVYYSYRVHDQFEFTHFR